ncbi:hypothetical protein BJX61DRAFT_535438 [Aspergillus egyptiacus]|nr:hypothetical protein BJX61DRAFT_535438 [Aspergillus egyptiacus]
MPSKGRKKKSQKVKGLSSKKVESSLRIEDNTNVELPSPLPPVADTTSSPEQQKSVDTNGPKQGSFRRRIRALTSGSSKSVNRQSWASKSSAELSQASVSTTTQSPKAKRASDTSGVVKLLRSGNDYMFLDLDFLEKEVESQNNPLIAAQGSDTDGKKVNHVRRMTGTEHKARPTGDSHVPGRQGDIRAWDHKNLRCITCRGPCAICAGPCCLHSEMQSKVSEYSLPAEEMEKAKRLLKIIEYLGAYAKEADTYSLCSLPGGCGRHVCPSCCGACPNEICQDIQCIDCKEDVWGPCDWHD